MGENVWWWICASFPRDSRALLNTCFLMLLPGLSVPVGRHLDDGLNYPTNPRFDNAGRWQRRKEWPSDLQ